MLLIIIIVIIIIIIIIKGLRRAFAQGAQAEGGRQREEVLNLLYIIIHSRNYIFKDRCITSGRKGDRGSNLSCSHYLSCLRVAHPLKSQAQGYILKVCVALSPFVCYSVFPCPLSCSHYLLHFSICACHPCAGAMLICFVSFQIYYH